MTRCLTMAVSTERTFVVSKKWIAVVGMMLGACAVETAAIEPMPVPEPEVTTPELPAVEQPAPSGYQGERDCLALEWPACMGRWADLSDPDTRWVPHPETDAPTFACIFDDARCSAAWFNDARCRQPYADKLQALCATKGGTCELAESGIPYCVR